MFTLRPATAEDDAAIRWLVRTGQVNPMGLDWRRFVVAVNAEGQVVGCGQVKLHGDGSRELASLAVHPDWRLRGVARAIIEHFIAAFPGELYLMCRAEICPIYEKFGFRNLQDQEMPRYFRRILRLARLLNPLFDPGGGVQVMRRG
jgi:N-acetylglutamate synthase-like GNAT family acetyltransferase